MQQSPLTPSDRAAGAATDAFRTIPHRPPATQEDSPLTPITYQGHYMPIPNTTSTLEGSKKSTRILSTLAILAGILLTAGSVIALSFGLPAVLGFAAGLTMIFGGIMGKFSGGFWRDLTKPSRWIMGLGLTAFAAGALTTAAIVTPGLIPAAAFASTAVIIGKLTVGGLISGIAQAAIPTFISGLLVSSLGLAFANAPADTVFTTVDPTSNFAEAHDTNPNFHIFSTDCPECKVNPQNASVARNTFGSRSDALDLSYGNPTDLDSDGSDTPASVRSHVPALHLPPLPVSPTVGDRVASPSPGPELSPESRGSARSVASFSRLVTRDLARAVDSPTRSPLGPMLPATIILTLPTASVPLNASAQTSPTTREQPSSH